MANELLLATQAQNSQQVSCCFWDYNSGNVLQIYKNGGSVRPKSLDILDTDYIITAEHTKPLLHVWAFNNQEVSKNVRMVLPEPANALSTSLDNKYVAVGIGSKLYIWELCSGKLLSVQQVLYQAITNVKFSNEGGYIVITGEDGMIVVYNLIDLINPHKNKAQSDLGQIDPLYQRMDHSLPITDLHMGTFSFKSRFITVSLDQSLRIYQLLDGNLLWTLIFDTRLSAVILDASCFNLYVGNTNGEIFKFDITQPSKTLEYHVEEKDKTLRFKGHKSKISCLDINIFNNRLASASDDLTINIWEINSRQILRTIELKSVPTNIKFVLTNEAMFAQNYKPTVLLSNLDRAVCSESNNMISVLQTDNFCLRHDEIDKKRIEENESVQDLQAEVSMLRKLNTDLLLQLQKCIK